MIFDWDKYAELAEELRQREDEAARRTAISRVYYAVYWKARKILEEDGFILSYGDSSHKQIWRTYMNKGRTRHGIGIQGDRLHEYRLKADYEHETEDFDDVVVKAFDAAGKTLAYLKQIQNN
jgi:uncharacterized protein (UPF0332 family)